MEPLKSLPAPRFGEFRSIRKCDFVDLILIHGISEASEYKQYIIPKYKRLDLTVLFFFISSRVQVETGEHGTEFSYSLK